VLVVQLSAVLVVLLGAVLVIELGAVLVASETHCIRASASAITTSSASTTAPSPLRADRKPASVVTPLSGAAAMLARLAAPTVSPRARSCSRRGATTTSVARQAIPANRAEAEAQVHASPNGAAGDGGSLGADSPKLTFRFMEALRDRGFDRLVAGYLGEPALVSPHKTTMRKAEPSVSGAWHQDGFFMGPVRSLNLWLALSRCGDEAPGLDIVPRRLEYYVRGPETRS
jgi:hypothetical protein